MRNSSFIRRFAAPALVGIAMSMLAVGTAAAQEGDGHRSLVVVGTGEAAARPDIAEVQAGVVTEAASAREALTANNQAMSALHQTLSSFGIEERDIQTAGFNVFPVYAHDERGNKPPRIAAYRVENRVAVKVRDLKRLGELLDAVVSRGANTVQDIRFDVAEPEPLRDEARTDAVADARRKAELYAKAAGVALGRVLSLREEDVGMPPPRPYMARAMAAEAAVPVAPGELTFEALVVITYEIAWQ